MKKYCVYDKGPNNPIEVWEYIDDLEEAMSYWYVAYAINKYGVEDTLPICMNQMGGYHTCYKPNVKCIIEANEWPNIATHKDLFRNNINNPSFRYGWIDSLGNTYMCNYMGHAGLAADLVLMAHKKQYTKWKLNHNMVNAPDDFLIDIGWIKVFNSPPYHAVLYDRVSKEALSKLDEIEKAKGVIQNDTKRTVD